jgi:hypothetical protein
MSTAPLASHPGWVHFTLKKRTSCVDFAGQLCGRGAGEFVKDVLGYTEMGSERRVGARSRVARVWTRIGAESAR